VRKGERDLEGTNAATGLEKSRFEVASLSEEELKKIPGERSSGGRKGKNLR